MKKHRRLEARKRVNESLHQLHETQTLQAQQVLEKHLEELEKEFSSRTELKNQQRKSIKTVVS